MVTMLSLAAFAQQPQSGTDEGAAQMKRLAQALKGAWSTTIKDEPTPENPKGETYAGREVWSEPGGGPLIEQYHAQPSSGEDLETALFWWDVKTHKYKGLWCAAINDEGCNGFQATWKEKDFVNDGEWLYHGKRLSWRDVFTFPTSDSFVQTLYIGEPGGELKLASTIHAMRVAPKKP